MGLPVVGEEPHVAEKDVVAKNLTRVDRVIGFHSGKGGVGKTFLAVNTAVALAASGKKVGLLDADVDCPNVVEFLNLGDQMLRGTSDGRITPFEHRGVQIISAHFLTDSPKAPMIIRGPIKHKMLSEFLSHVDWGELDVLIIDLPPGTADVPLSSMQIGNLDGMVVVTTPQKEAVLDARKSALMALDLDVPLIGIVENMSGEIFGTGSGKSLAKELNVPFLGSVPLAKEIRKLNAMGNIALLEEVYAQPDLLRAVAGEDVPLQKTLWQRITHRT